MNLERALHADEEYLRLLKNKAFARAAYESFCNNVYINEKRERFSCSWRYAGGMIAAMRGEGEDYLDYYLGDFVEEQDRNEIESHAAAVQGVYNRLGWRLLTVDDQVHDYKAAFKLLNDKRTLPKTETPSWYDSMKTYMKDWDERFSDGSAISLTHHAANNGQIAQDEYDYLLDRLIIDAEAFKVVHQDDDR